MIQIVVVIGLALVVFLLILLSTYNALMHQRQEVRDHWAQMDETLKQRYDLMPGFIAVVKSAGGEAAAKLPAVISAKNQAAVAFNPAQLAAAEIALTAAIHAVLASAAGNPVLSFDPRFIEIRLTLISCEQKIDASCRQYNDRVLHLNESLGTFPTFFTARAIGLKPQPTFVLPISA